MPQPTSPTMMAQVTAKLIAFSRFLILRLSLLQMKMIFRFITIHLPACKDDPDGTP
jgi:hypothetical protein